MVNPCTEKNRNEGYFQDVIDEIEKNPPAIPFSLVSFYRNPLYRRLLTEMPDDLNKNQIDRILRIQIIDKLNVNLKKEKRQRTHPEMEGHFEPYLKKYIDLADLKITTVPLLKIKAFQGLRDPPAFYKGDLNQKEREEKWHVAISNNIIVKARKRINNNNTNDDDDDRKPAAVLSPTDANNNNATPLPAPPPAQANAAAQPTNDANARMEALLANNNNDANANAQMLVKIIADIEALKIQFGAINTTAATGSAAAASSTGDIHPSSSNSGSNTSTTTTIDKGSNVKKEQVVIDLTNVLDDDSDNNNNNNNNKIPPRTATTDVNVEIAILREEIKEMNIAATIATTTSPVVPPSTDVASPATTTVSATAAASSTATIMESDLCGIADDDDELTAQPPTDVDAQMATKMAKALADIEAWSKIIS